MRQTLFDSNRDLFERVCAEDNLLEAFLSVKRNKGAPGVDGVTIEEFETHLQNEIAKLEKDLRSWQYRPKPVKRVEIPKEDGSMRKLGIPCIRDRVMQACLKTILEEIFEPHFSNSSYGFRPGRRQHDAIKEAQSYVQEEREWIVDIDLERSFDTMSQDRLIYRLSLKVPDKRILRLVGITLRVNSWYIGWAHVTIQRVDSVQRENNLKDKAFRETGRSVYETYVSTVSQK